MPNHYRKKRKGPSDAEMEKVFADPEAAYAKQQIETPTAAAVRRKRVVSGARAIEQGRAAQRASVRKGVSPEAGLRILRRGLRQEARGKKLKERYAR
jgi:hypothetical protein